MKEAVILTLPHPPSGNHMWKHTRTGVHYLTETARKYYAAVGELFRLSGQVGLMEGRLHVEFDIYPPDRRKRDLDNAVKVLGDACTKAGIWFDDSQIYKLVVEKMDVVKDGRVSVRVTTITN